MDKIGILGGSFDPVHNGHLLLAESVREQAGLDKMLFMPTRIQPFKQGKAVSPDADRIMMLALAIKGDENLRVTRVEIDDPEISYTILSLEKLREEMGDGARLYFVIGSDMFVNMAKWYRAGDLLRQFPVIVGRRRTDGPDGVPEYAESLKKEYGTEVTYVENPLCEISSSEIRRRVAAGLSIRYMVPESVRGYIYETDLYRR